MDDVQILVAAGVVTVVDAAQPFHQVVGFELVVIAHAADVGLQLATGGRTAARDIDGALSPFRAAQHRPLLMAPLSLRQTAQGELSLAAHLFIIAHTAQLRHGEGIVDLAAVVGLHHDVRAVFFKQPFGGLGTALARLSLDSQQVATEGCSEEVFVAVAQVL